MSRTKLTRSRPKVEWNSLMISTAICCCQLHQPKMPHFWPKKPSLFGPRTGQFIFMIWWKQSFMMPRKICSLMILMSLLTCYKHMCISRSPPPKPPRILPAVTFPRWSRENGLSFLLKHMKFGISWMISPSIILAPQETTSKPGKEDQHARDQCLWLSYDWSPPLHGRYRWWPHSCSIRTPWSCSSLSCWCLGTGPHKCSKAVKAYT